MLYFEDIWPFRRFHHSPNSSPQLKNINARTDSYSSPRNFPKQRRSVVAQGQGQKKKHAERNKNTSFVPSTKLQIKHIIMLFFILKMALLAIIIMFMKKKKVRLTHAQTWVTGASRKQMMVYPCTTLPSLLHVGNLKEREMMILSRILL